MKRAGTQSGDAALREQLFEVLMDAREELVAALEEPAQAGPDPVRPLFMASWQRLAGVLRELGPQLGDQDALRYLGFVAAADALVTVDAVGPDLGFEFSSDGLRRLARVLAPEDPADPLDAPEAVDPELRRALDFGDPLPAPELLLDPEPAVIRRHRLARRRRSRRPPLLRRRRRSTGCSPGCARSSPRPRSPPPRRRRRCLSTSSRACAAGFRSAAS